MDKYLLALSKLIPDKVIEQIPDIKEINTPLRLAHFFSQCAHESDSFSRIFENLNYSAYALRETFPKRFNYEQSIAYARDPVRIGNRVYADRMGNGNEASGEGFRYRGRGYLQLTGHTNYAAFSKAVGEDCVTYPDLVATKYPLTSAGWFFSMRNIWKACDQGNTPADIVAVTKLINGGTTGLADRTVRFRMIYSVLTSST